MLQPELMDDPSLDPAAHADALHGLARINRLSRAASAHLPALRTAARAGRGTVRVLDVACGDGDGAVKLAARAAADGIQIELTILDRSLVAADRAARRAEAAAIKGFRVVVADAIENPLPEADLIVCSLFLHHLTDDAAVRLLRNMRGACRCVISINDLRRSRWGTLLARTVPPIVTRSRVVRTDAVISARAAFSPAELLSLAERAGMGGAGVRPTFPARMTMTWAVGP